MARSSAPSVRSSRFLRKCGQEATSRISASIWRLSLWLRQMRRQFWRGVAKRSAPRQKRGYKNKNSHGRSPRQVALVWRVDLRARHPAHGKNAPSERKVAMMHGCEIRKLGALTACGLSLAWAMLCVEASRSAELPPGKQPPLADQVRAGQEAQKAAPAPAPAHEPTAAELSKNETVATALMRTFGSQRSE